MKRRRANPIVIVLICILAVLVIAAVGIFIWQSRSASQQPEKQLVKYMKYIESKSYEKMYNMLDEKSKKSRSKKDYIERNQKIYEGIEASNIKLQTKEVNKVDKGREVVYIVTMDSVAGEIQYSGKALFTRESLFDEYRLSWSDAMIFPNLEETDKVSVSSQQPKRGSILDRNGELLAGPGTAKSIGLVPGKMSADPAADLEKLSQLLGVTVETINAQLGAAWVKDDSLVPVKTVSVAKSQELETELLTIPGVLISDTEVRGYPLGAKAAHLIGYVQNVTAEDLEEHEGEGYTSTSVIGKSGVESLYEEKLRGTTGARIVIITEDGQEKQEIASTKVIDGENITLTIDSALQSALYDQLQADKSCSVAMNPYTGEVLALVSTPSFDDNEFILGMSEEQWNALNNDENKPMYNRFRQVWCPGSSFKPITAAVGLDAGTLNPDEDYGSSGLSWQKDESWGDYYVTTLHEYNPAVLQNALIYSDNIYFAKVALNTGADKFMAGLDKLGFNEEIPFEIVMSKSQYANEGGKIDSEIQLADSGYGQGQILVNPLHLASLYTAFVNGGNVIKPYLLYQDEPKREVWLEGGVAPDHAERIRAALEQVVNDPNGTGYGAHRDDVMLAGKTGTAEIKADQNDTTGTELGWFGVFTQDAAAPKPILMMSMVEDVKDRGGSGYVVDKSTAVLEQYLAQ